MKSDVTFIIEFQFFFTNILRITSISVNVYLIKN